MTRQQILDRFKLKKLADDNLEFDENSSKFSKWIENTVGKGEIARYEQFLLSHIVFKRLVSQGRQKVWEWVKIIEWFLYFILKRTM